MNSVIIHELHNLRAMALVAHDAIQEVMDDEERAPSAARVMVILADRAIALANQIDAAALAASPHDKEPEAQPSDEEPSGAGGLLLDLSDDVMHADDLAQLAYDRALNHQNDGKLVALLDAALPRLKRARGIAEKLQEGLA